MEFQQSKSWGLSKIGRLFDVEEMGIEPIEGTNDSWRDSIDETIQKFFTLTNGGDKPTEIMRQALWIVSSILAGLKMVSYNVIHR